MSGILVIRGGAIGDFICTLPVLTALRSTFPKKPVALLGYERVLPLAVAGGLCDQTRSLESRSFAAFFAVDSDLDPEWSSYFEGFETILSFLYDPDEILLENLKRCNRRMVLNLDPRPTNCHVTRHLCSLLRAINIVPDSHHPVLKLGKAKTARLPSQSIALHPGSGSESKNWHLDHWITLIRHLTGSGRPVLLISGEADVERSAKIVEAVPTSPLQLVGAKSLLEVGMVLQSASLFVGHDSGISHLAAAVGTPTISLFGPTHPRLWAPSSPRSVVLWQNRVWDPGSAIEQIDREISVDENSPNLVKAQVDKMLGE